LVDELRRWVVPGHGVIGSMVVGEGMGRNLWVVKA
jgi:hypothetical protein